MKEVAHLLKENFKGTKPAAIDFMGNIIPVTSTINILTFILEYFILMDSKKIEKMLCDNYLKGVLYPEISICIRRPKKLSNGMILERNFNSQDIYRAIRKVLKYFEIDENNVKVFLRNENKRETLNSEIKNLIVINSFKFKNC